MSLVRQALTLISGIMTGAGVVTAQQASIVVGDIMVIVPAVISLGSVGWSIYAHFGMRKVPVANVQG